MATNLTAQRVGVEVRVALTRRGMTQTDLAQQLGLSQTAISRRLTGEVPFDVEELAATADFLAVEIADLFPVVAA